MAEGLLAAGLTTTRSSPVSWKVVFPWQTAVFGCIRREVDETVELSIVQRPDGWELAAVCEPVQTHAAHAAGAGGVILVALVVWVAGGLVGGALPALTTILVGGLLITVTRQWAFDALERRLRHLAADLGSALWPGLSSQIVSAYQSADSDSSLTISSGSGRSSARSSPK